MSTAAIARVQDVPTLESLSADQIATIKAIPPHVDDEIKAISDSRPLSFFLGEDQFKLEQEKVFRRLPVPMAVSALLPNPGDVLAVDSYGPDVLLTRAKDGVVRAFLNACTHKGASLVEAGEPARAPRLICPYHAWTFSLEGKLIGVPRQEGFAGLCREKRNLAELPCREIGGMIWVGLTRDSEPDFSDLEGQLMVDLDALRIPQMYAYGRQRFELKANWKLVLEPFLEPYHVKRLHANSVAPLFADVAGMSHRLGRNIRQISGKVQFSPDKVEGGENIHKSITHAYTAFPNLVVVTSPYYISMMILAPQAIDRTIVDYVMLTRGAPDNPKAEELFAKSYAMILDVFGNEDFKAAEKCHRGLEQGAMPDVIYCGLEDMIPLYYSILDEETGAA
ncbi:aromatic ring-hydroxylating oxygenase subunit alpha [Sphingopyxis sp.]|uniref:aromatic ring-hydroxylating oxygenase subunit alpha n=1 Tax=Sphingopyxis sp. TaxID=1908224 RepID=UPI003BAAD373